jgi:hypothetical protein
MGLLLHLGISHLDVIFVDVKLVALAAPCSVQPTGRDNAGHSAPTASGRGSMTRLALVSFASVSAATNTLTDRKEVRLQFRHGGLGG